MPPPPPIPCWPPLSRLELVRRSEAPPTGWPGPIGFGGPDDTIVAGNGRATNSAETSPRSRAPPVTWPYFQHGTAARSAKIEQEQGSKPAATSQQNPVRRESGDPELEPAPNRAAKARRDASSAAGAAHCREEQHCHRRAG